MLAGMRGGGGEPDQGYYGCHSGLSARYNACMFKLDEYEPGTAVPITGRYELCHVLGRRTGVIQELPLGEVLPAAPRGWFWTPFPIQEPSEKGPARSVRDEGISGTKGRHRAEPN
jgi:hypothetical protein